MNLYEMLDDAPVTLVLGAGASMDYGLPSWSQLKDQLIELAISHGSSLNISENVLEYWANELAKSAADKTLDQIAGDLETEEFYFAFQKLTALALLLGEKKAAELQADLWIEKFSNTCISYLNDTSVSSDRASYERRVQNLNEISIVSLNYDRVFQFKVMQQLSEKVESQRFSRKQKRLLQWPDPKFQFKIIQPHGSLGHFDSPARTGTSIGSREFYQSGRGPFSCVYSGHSCYGPIKPIYPFGGVEKFMSHCKAESLNGDLNLNVIAVDDLIEGADMSNYKAAATVLANANVVCIGLSQHGFNQSKLNFSTSRSVTFTNTRAEYEEIDTDRQPSRESVRMWDHGLLAGGLMDELAPNNY